MEQLTGHAIEGLVRIARGRSAKPGIPLPPAPFPSLWKRQGPPASGQDSPRAEPGQPPAEESCPQLDAPLVGIERRLARRAEALWDSLRGSSPLPDASAAAALLGPPFSGHAVLVSVPQPLPEAAAPTCRAAALPRVNFVGEALAALSLIHPGVLVPDSSAAAPLAARLAALAVKAVADAAPAVLDSEGTPAGRRAPLLMRAVALPMAAAGATGASVVIIVSWRELLSADETDALHRELAAAIDWMQAHKPHG